MAQAIRILPHYTYDDYVNWEGRWEIIHGIPYAMSPLPVPNHQRIAGNLFSEFRFQMKACKHCKVYPPLDYRIADDIIIQPDMLIVCGDIRKKFLDFTPALVVEILSPSTALKDRHSKYAIYEQQQVPYYLIVSPDTEQVEIFELVNGKYDLKQQGHGISHAFRFDGGCEALINFSEVWK